MNLIRIFVALFWAILLASPVFVFTGMAYAQQGGGVVVFPPITPGDCASWKALNILQDAGAACGGSGTTPGIPASSLGFVGDGSCSPALNPTSCTGTDNTAAYNAAMTTLCALPVLKVNHVFVGRAQILFDSKNYYFASSPTPVPCQGIGFTGNSWGGTVFSSTSGVSFIQFGTFSTTPANYFIGGSQWGSVYGITFFEPGNGTAGSRVGAAIQDNGSGYITVRDIHCYNLQYCFNAPYGGQSDDIYKIFVEYSDVGIYWGPLANQSHVGRYDCQFTTECIVGEGGAQVTFDGTPDLNSCSFAGTSLHTGGCVVFESNVNNNGTTRQGVWWCPGTPGSATPCGGYTYDLSWIFDNLWLEENNGGLGYQPNCYICFTGNPTDAYRGLTLRNTYIVGGALPLANSSVIGCTATTCPQRIYAENTDYSGAGRAFWLNGNVIRATFKNTRISTGATAPAAQTGGSNYWYEYTGGDAPIALTPGASVATDASLGNNFTLSLTANSSMTLPTNLVRGTTYTWKLTQDATGGRVVTWAAQFLFANDPSGGMVYPAASSVTLVTCFFDTVLNCTRAPNVVTGSGNAGNQNAVSYALDAFPYGANAHISRLGGQTTTGVTTGASTIYTPSNVGGNLVIVTGSDGTNKFNDLVMCNKTTGAIQIFGGASGNYAGSPATRTYGGTTTCQLTMSTGTYNVNATTIEGGER